MRNVGAVPLMLAALMAFACACEDGPGAADAATQDAGATDADAGGVLCNLAPATPPCTCTVSGYMGTCNCDGGAGTVIVTACDSSRCLLFSTNCLAPGFVACCMTNYAADATLRDRCAAFCSTGPAAGDLACLSSGC